jgi:hypothetical protein
LETVTNKGDCLEAEYRYSLLVQNLVQDLEQYDLNQALIDSGKLVLNLPDTLNRCGQTAMAAKIATYLPK